MLAELANGLCVPSLPRESCSLAVVRGQGSKPAASIATGAAGRFVVVLTASRDGFILL